MSNGISNGEGLNNNNVLDNRYDDDDIARSRRDIPSRANPKVFFPLAAKGSVPPRENFYFLRVKEFPSSPLTAARLYIHNESTVGA